MTTPTPVRRFVTQKQVAQMLGIKRSTLVGWCARGRFPQPIDVGIHKLIWPVEDVEAALARRQAPLPAKGGRERRRVIKAKREPKAK
jgi:predicted DNA-binding transcriptional regulator AlpA